MNETTRVLIADDHPVFRGGLRQILEASGAFSQLHEAEDGEAALTLIRSERPQVAVLDMAMPKLDGLAILRAIHDERVPTAVVFLTLHSDAAMVEEALNLGALGYLLKDSGGPEIVRAVLGAARGELQVSPQLLEALNLRRARKAALGKKEPGLAALSPAERRVLALVADGRTSREIAERLFLSVRTVENHRAAAAAKLDLRGAHALVKFALAHRAELS